MAKSSLKVLGKLLGGGLGFAAGGIYGAFAGLTLGHAIDAGWMRWRPRDGVRLVDPRSARVEFLFLWLGHLAKADGRVSEGEVVAAERLMQRLQLDHGGRDMAVRAFQRGRNQALDVIDEVARFRRLLNPSREELGEMLRSLAAFARNDGPMTPAERGLIERLGSAFGFNRESVTEQIAERSASAAEPTLAQCYAALGVAASISDADLTRAWRRLLAQHHPDKLQGQGADAAALRRADTRTRELRAAYERIIAARSERR
jgi:DnaJ like chaperone protein